MSNIIEEINFDIKRAKEGGQSVKDISDTYHTFGELYKHRDLLAINLTFCMDGLGFEVWVSQQHHPDNDPMYPDSFLLGIELDEHGKKSIQYHLPMSYWPLVEDLHLIEYSPFYDGTGDSDAVLKMLEELALGD